MRNQKISKREFLRSGIYGLGGIVMAGVGIKLLSNFKNAMETKNENGYKAPEGLWKWSCEARYYNQNGENAECELCPHLCIVRPGKMGTCRTHINVEGKLYSIAYGNPCAAHVDPIEKKPLFHFYPSTKIYSISTAGCNLRCLNCQNWELSQVSPKDAQNYDMMPETVIESTIATDCKSIAYTYGEPIVYYEYTYDTAKLAREKGIKNVLVSAGYINEKPLRDLCKYIDAANIDLKSFKDEIYKKLNGATLQPILNTLKVMSEEGVWLEITNLIVPSWTDDFDMIKEMCEWLNKNGLSNYPLHFSRFTPLYKLTQLPYTPVSSLEKAREIAITAGIKYVYIGNVPVTDGEDTICPKCKKKLIARRGFFIAENHVKNGTCEYCKEKIHGVF